MAPCIRDLSAHLPPRIHQPGSTAVGIYQNVETSSDIHTARANYSYQFIGRLLPVCESGGFLLGYSYSYIEIRYHPHAQNEAGGISPPACFSSAPREERLRSLRSLRATLPQAVARVGHA